MKHGTMAARLLVVAALVVSPLLGATPRSNMDLDIPATSDQLARIRDADDVTAMRAHAWQVCENITAGAPEGAPTWFNWETRAAAAKRMAAQLPLTGVPVSAVFRTRSASPGAVPTTRAVIRRPPIAVTVHFNKPAAEHIQANRYSARTAFAALKTQFDQTNAPAQERKILEFPTDAIAVKAIWRLLPAVPGPNDIWLLPVYDDKVRNPSAAYPPSKWERCVAIDFAGGDTGAKPDAMLAGERGPVKWVSIDRFFRVSLNAQQASEMNASPGDQAILVGLHVATKELPNWVWATFWWHDRPNDGEFALGRPADVTRSVWGNYLMNVDFGRGEGTGDFLRRPVFNPWLEAGLKGGIASNCMSCHQQASLTSEFRSAPFTPIRSRPLPDTDPTFRDRIRTDFIWSLSKISE